MQMSHHEKWTFFLQISIFIDLSSPLPWAVQDSPFQKIASWLQQPVVFTVPMALFAFNSHTPI